VAGCHAQAQYVPRTTQGSDALALVLEHWPAFRDRLEERAGSLPGFVRDELEAFMTCGDFEHLEGDSEPVDESLVACVQLALPLRAVGPSPCESRPDSPMLVRGFGMQLHAAVSVDGRDRKRLERVCRYLLRPPFALDAVQRTADGQVWVHFKKPNRFGATYAQMSPHTFLARLCALVPPPRAHTVLYYGVLSAHHGLGSAVVPHADEPAPEPKQLALFVCSGARSAREFGAGYERDFA